VNNGTWTIKGFVFEWDFEHGEGCYLYFPLTGGSAHFESLREARMYAEAIAYAMAKVE
jgi:hypothetical protein